VADFYRKKQYKGPERILLITAIMPTVLIVEKTGSIKPYGIKSYSEAELYKKAGFKTPDGFQQHASWDVASHGTQYRVALYGKTTGRANTENKYDFPPPADGLLFFGNCLLVNKGSDGTVLNLSPNEWDSIYRKLFGGFHDLDVAHSSSEDELDTDEEIAQLKEAGEKVKLTRDGYIDDGFVVDDSEDAQDESSEEEVAVVAVTVAPKKKKAAAAAKKTKTVAAAESGVEMTSLSSETELYLDCTKELVEEEYV
jgi:hypothetical protein